MSKLIFGHGYLGSRAARRWRELGEDVYVVTRSGQRARQLAAEGYAPIVADVVRPETLVDLPAADTVLYAIGFDRSAGHSMRAVFVDGLHAALDNLPDPIQKFIYISSTGVYGQSHGESVDEHSPCQPEREGGRAVLEAEQLLAAHRIGSRAIVLRLSGLYGPGRIPNRVELVRGESIAAVPDGLLNLIHVDDAVSVVMAADAQAKPPRAYVVSDGHPVQRREYYAELARALGAPSPEFAPPAADDPSAARALSSKRVINFRMSKELNVVLKYPTYRDGLAAIVAEE